MQIHGSSHKDHNCFMDIERNSLTNSVRLLTLRRIAKARHPAITGSLGVSQVISELRLIVRSLLTELKPKLCSPAKRTNAITHRTSN